MTVPLAPRTYWCMAGLIIALALWLHRTVVDGTLISDDWDHYAMVAGLYPVERAPWQLYEFVRADRADYRALLESGRLPWWTEPDLQISFLRPLASLLTFADFAWLGADAHPARAHWHSLGWWLACLVATAGLLQCVLPRWSALTALLIFALDDAHALPVAWSASRAELVAHAFMLAGLWSYVAAQNRPRPVLSCVANALVCLSFAAGEHALSMFAYFVAFVLFGPQSGPPRRVRRLLSLCLPLLVYLGLHATWHYGTRGSSFYADPIAEPAAYMRELPTRAALLAGDLVFGYTSDWWFMLPPWVLTATTRGWLSNTWLTNGWPLTIQLCIGSSALLGLGFAGWRLSRPTAPAGARQLGWLVLGSLGTIPPLCGAFAMTRLTVAPAVGVDVLVASMLLFSLRRLGEERTILRRSGLAILALSIVGVHVLLAAQRSADLSVLYAAWSRSEDAWVERAALGGPELAARHVIVLSASDVATQYCLPYIRRFHHTTAPASSQLMLPPATEAFEVERVAENALVLRSTAPHGHSGFQNSAYRRQHSAFRVGERIHAPRFEVEVLAVDDGVPVALRFVFARSVEDPGYLFVYPRKNGLERVELPGPGGTLRLPPPAAALSPALSSGA